MASSREIVEFLDSTLSLPDYKDVSINGLQVGAPDEIERIGFAVDACLAAFRKAAEEKCQLLIVHHGLFWKRSPRMLTGPLLERVKALIAGDVGLYAVHIPLDAHPRLGNNAELARILGVKKPLPFGEYRGKKIGFMGKLKRPGTLTDIATLLKGTLRAECVIHGFGKNGDEKITSVGIVSGFGGDCVTEAGKEGLDLVVTGEFSHSDVHPAKEAGVSVIAAGHYVTETLGLQALRPVLEKRFKVSTVFIDEPTGM